jgi:uncharacterized protein (DUF1015 family)
MTKVRPFRAIRPVKDKVHLIASRSVDTYTSNELYAKLAENPYTFLHIIKPDFLKEKRNKKYTPELLQKVKNKFNEFLKLNYFVQDDKPSFYLYRQIKPEDTFTGIIACCSADDYYNGVIKKHEQTLSAKEETLKNYLEVCDFNAEPVNLTYPADTEIDKLTDKIITTEPLYDFTTTDRIRHQVWPINKSEYINLIVKRFEQIPAVYIADGHHRIASSALLAKEKKEKNKKHNGNEGYNFFLSILFPDHELKIYDYNRVVKDLNGLSDKDFLKKLSEKFEIEEKGNKTYAPKKLHNFSMYLSGKWYSLTLKKEFINKKDPAASLDASLLSEHILSPILNIHDLRTDKRIAFVNGLKKMEGLKEEVDSGRMKVAFGLFPVSMKQLKQVADAGAIMPPKSTWIEPKLRSGLVIYNLNQP